MNQPWKIVQNFQERCKNNQLNATVEQFLPSYPLNDLTQRIHKLKDVVQKSSKAANESRIPALNDSVFSFCHNCSCGSCLNQSSLYKLTDQQSNNLLNPMDVLKSYDQFIELQRQQFILFLEKSVTGLDNPVTNDPHQASCSGLMKGYNSDQSTMPLESSPQARSVCENTYSDDYQQSSNKKMSSTMHKRNQSSASGECIHVSAVDDEVLSTNPVVREKAEIYTRSTNACNENETIKRKHSDLSEVYSSSEFYEDFDDKFKPVRRSKSRCNDVSSLSAPFNTDIKNLECQKPPSSRKFVKSVVPLNEKKKILQDLSVIFRIKEARVLVEKLESSINTEISEEEKINSLQRKKHSSNKADTISSISSVPNTRSGRSVQKPGAYWVASSRKSASESSSTLTDNQTLKRSRKRPLTKKSPPMIQEDKQNSKRKRKRRK